MNRFAVALGTVGMMGSLAVAGEDSEVEAVRAFLADPPRLERLLVRRTLAVNPISFRSARQAKRFLAQVTSGELSMPGATSIYEVRFQAEPPAFFLRALLDIDEAGRTDAPRLTPFAGRYGTDWWMIPQGVVGQVHLLQSSNGCDVTSDGQTNSVHLANERWATEFLRLGMFEVLPATLRWAEGGGRFSAALEDGGRCQGVVTQGEDPGVAQIEYRYDHAPQGKRIAIRSMRLGGRWFPALIRAQTAVWENGRTQVSDYAGFEVVEASLASATLPRVHFSPEPYLRTNDLWVELHQGRFFVLETVGTNVTRRLVLEQQHHWNWLRLARTAFLVGVGLLGVRLAWHWARAWRRPRMISGL